MEAKENMEDTKIIEAEEDVTPNIEEIGKGVVAAVHPVTSNTTAGHMECVTTQVPNVEPLQRAKRRTRFGKTKCWGANAITPDRLGWYLLVIIM